MQSRKRSGNTLALIAVAAGFFVLAMAFFIMNYNQIIGSHKQAQTAIDAAALQAAIDIGQIVIGPTDGAVMGYVALVDQPPKNNNINETPIVGINTLMATARLDAIIADKLQNTTMQVLAIHDLERVKHDSQLLRTKILAAVNGAPIKNKNGQTINVQADVEAAYDANEVRLGKGKRAGSVSIKIGRLASDGMTNTPVPQPQSMAQVGSGDTVMVGSTICYKPYVPIKATVGGNQLTYMFTATASEPSLIEHGRFVEASSDSSDYLAPSAVQVETDQEVSAISGESKTGKLHTVAYAIAGSVNQTFPSGALQISFPMKPPPTGSIDSSSVKNLMNQSQIPVKWTASEGSPPSQQNASAIGGTSPYSRWNSQSKGHWFKAVGGDFPKDPGATQKESDFRGRAQDDPSVVLSFLVYDWLHHMYLRPNIESAVNTLASNLWTNSGATSYRGDFLPGAIADSNDILPVSFGIFSVSPDNDPRDLLKFDEDPEAYKRQFANVFGYVAADMTLPNQTLVVAMDKDSHVTTTNGQPPETLLELWDAIANMNAIGVTTYKAAYEVFTAKTKEVDRLEKEFAIAPGSATSASAERDKALKQVRRALIVMNNAQFVITTSLAMENERKTITALGVTKYSTEDFGIVSGHFYPPDRAASKEEIAADQETISTGQPPACGSGNWLTALSKDGRSNLPVYVPTAKAMLKKADPATSLLQPAYASTAVPQASENIFVFTVNGDVSKDSTKGLITKSQPQINQAEVVLKQDQLEYQNLEALITPSGSPRFTEKWNCVARNNGANYNGNSYFSSQQSTPGQQAFPSIVAEWSLRCPVPVPMCQEKPIVSLIGSSAGGMVSSRGHITTQTDSAGNISYFFKGEPMHFLAGDEWMAAIRRSEADRLADGIRMKGSGLYNRAGTQIVGLGSQYTDAQWQDWIDSHKLLTNTAERADYEHKRGGDTAAAQLNDYRYSAYSQAVFEIWDVNTCPTLYRWSS